MASNCSRLVLDVAGVEHQPDSVASDIRPIETAVQDVEAEIRMQEFMSFMDDNTRRMFSLRLQGYSWKEIARRLGISPKTVDNHLQNLYAKIGVTTRAGAALFAIEHQLL